MFQLFNKKIICKLYSPVLGKMIPLEEVKDKVFAEKMMGDGVAFIPEDNTIYAPCNGKIVMIASTKHAIGIITDNQIEILIHIGMDSVNLNGEGFEPLLKVGDKVKKHDPILKLDWNLMKERHIDLTTPLIITNGNNYEMKKTEIGEVNKMTEIITLVKR